MKAIFLDLETTGLDPFSHRVIEIAFRVIDLSLGEEEEAYENIVMQPFEVWEKHDPTSIQVNGFTWEKVLQGKSELEVREEIIEIFTSIGIERGRSVFICQNPAFDRNFFNQIIDVYTQEQYHWPYHWLDFASMFWALQVKWCKVQNNMFPEKMNLSKNAIAESFGLPIESSPHRAINGVNHLVLCYKTIIENSPDW